MEPPEPDVMRRPPRLANKPVITLRHAASILLHGSLIATAGIAAYLIAGRTGEATIEQVRGVTFCTIAVAQLLFAIACRSPRRTMPELGLFSNRYLVAAVAGSVLLQIAAVTLPGLRRVFAVDALFLWDWGLIFVLGLTPVTIVEVSKLLRSRQSAPSPA
jgi:Ca2+-transporting ATPase